MLFQNVAQSLMKLLTERKNEETDVGVTHRKRSYKNIGFVSSKETCSQSSSKKQYSTLSLVSGKETTLVFSGSKESGENEKLIKGEDNRPWQRQSLTFSVSSLDLPENFKVGESVGGGDCFFDSVSRCLELMKPNEKFNAKILRECSYSYAQNSDWVKIAVVNYARSLTGHLHGVSDDDIWNAYLLGIRYSSEDVDEIKRSGAEIDADVYKTLTAADYGDTLVAPIWGRSEIEGRIICTEWIVKLHVIEKYIVEGQEIWTDQIVDKLGSRSLENINYDEGDTIHIINTGNLHFWPVLTVQNVQFGEPCFSEASNVLSVTQYTF